MICAYCSSAIEDDVKRCPSCGAAHPEGADAAALPTDPLTFRRAAWCAIAISLAFSALCYPFRADLPFLLGSPLVLWAFVVMPAGLLYVTIRAMRRPGARILEKLVLLVPLVFLCFILSFIGMMP